MRAGQTIMQKNYSNSRAYNNDSYDSVPLSGSYLIPDNKSI